MTNRSRPRRIAIALTIGERENVVMGFAGRVHRGVVVLDGDVSLPEGMAVIVSPQQERPGGSAAVAGVGGRRVQLPLVRSDRPGTLTLTNDMIAEVLDEEDAMPR